MKIAFLAIAGNSLDHFSTLEDDDGRDGCNSILDGEFHVLGDVDFSNFGVSVVIGCQFINDWTQSFARASAVGIEIDQYWSIRAEHVGFEYVRCEFCCHVVLLYLGARFEQSTLN